MTAVWLVVCDDAAGKDSKPPGRNPNVDSGGGGTTPAPLTPVVAPPAVALPSAAAHGLTVTLDFGGGKVATFGKGKDLGDYVGEFVRQKCYLAVDPAFPDWRVYFRPDADGKRDEVVVEYGRALGGTAKNWLMPYSAVIKKSGATLHTYVVPKHWWYARWKWESAARPIVRTPATLIARKWILSFGPAGMMGADPNRVRTPITWKGPMDAPRGLDPGFASGGDDPQIGYLTENAADYVISGNPVALASVRSEANWSGNCSYHFRDDSGLPLDVVGKSLRFVGDTNGTVRLRDFHYTPPTDPEMPIVDSPHMKPLAVLQFMLTDDPFFLEEMHAAVDYHHLYNGNKRFTHKLQGMMYDGETRAYAWGLRDLFYAAMATPAVTPSWLRAKSYFEKPLLGDNVSYSMDYLKSPAKVHRIFRVWTASNSSGVWTSAWLSTVCGMIASVYAAWKPIFEWAIDMQIQMTSGASGWCRGWQPYIFYVIKWSGPTDPGLTNVKFLIPDPSLDSITCNTWGEAWAFCAAGSNGMRDGPDPIKLANWDGHSLLAGPFTSTPSYLLHVRSALAMAATYGIPGAKARYEYLHGEVLIADQAAKYGAPPGQARFSVDPLDTPPRPASPTAVPAPARAAGALSTLAPNTARNVGSYLSGEVGGAYITDFSGTCYDPVAQRVLLFGGGHGPSNETDIRAFSSTAGWSSLYPSTPRADMTLANGDSILGRWISTNHPYARHTYGMTVVVGRRFYMMARQGMPYDTGSLPVPAWGGRICWCALDDPKFPWTYSKITDAATPWNYYNNTATLDPVSGKIVMLGEGVGAGAGSLQLYDPAADATQAGPRMPPFFSHRTIYFPPDGCFYVFSDSYNATERFSGIVWKLTLNRTNPGASTIVKLATTGRRPASPAYCAFDYDSVNRIIGGFAGNSGIVAERRMFFAFDPVTLSWDAQVMQIEAGSAGTPHPVWRCASFDTASGCFVFINDPISFSTWAYRYRG